MMTMKKIDVAAIEAARRGLTLHRLLLPNCCGALGAATKNANIRLRK
jgi:hypothetical protein